MNLEEVEFRPYARLQYMGMLDDLEVDSPTDTLEISDIKEITSRYDRRFEEIFKRGTKSPELGYAVTKLIGVGAIPVVKPEIPSHDLSSEKPDEAAAKGTRNIYWEGSWHEASIWEWDLVRPGNRIKGPAVIESPVTTLLLPPDSETYLDQYRNFHLRTK